MALSKKAKTRLTILIDYMASLPKSASGHFNMAHYFSHSGTHSHSELQEGRDLEVKDLNLCGTQACALGWAATAPALRKAGLRMNVLTRDFYINGREYSSPHRAAMDFFGINDEKAEALFNHRYDGLNDNIKTPKQWAAKARRLLKKWEAKASTRCQHELGTPQGQVCLEAALCLAHGRSDDWSLNSDPIISAAADRMRVDVGDALFVWNDEPERTQAEVVAKLRAVALGG